MPETAIQMSSPMLVKPAYRPLPDTYDEMFDADLNPRSANEIVTSELLAAPSDQISELRQRADRMFLRMGVTFNVYGEVAGAGRVFPFGGGPRIIDAGGGENPHGGPAPRG